MNDPSLKASFAPQASLLEGALRLKILGIAKGLRSEEAWQSESFFDQRLNCLGHDSFSPMRASEHVTHIDGRALDSGFDHADRGSGPLFRDYVGTPAACVPSP